MFWPRFKLSTSEIQVQSSAFQTLPVCSTLHTKFYSTVSSDIPNVTQILYSISLKVQPSPDLRCQNLCCSAFMLLAAQTQYTGSSKMRDLDQRCKHFHERTDTETGFLVMWSSTHMVFLNMRTHIFLHILHAHVCTYFSCNKHCHCCNQYDGNRARESTVDHQVSHPL